MKEKKKKFMSGCHHKSTKHSHDSGFGIFSLHICVTMTIISIVNVQFQLTASEFVFVCFAHKSGISILKEFPLS